MAEMVHADTKASRRGLVRVISWALLLGAAIYGIMIPFVSEARGARTLYTAALASISLSSLYFLRRGWVAQGGALALAGITGLLTMALWNPDSGAVVYAGFAVVVVMVALLHGTQVALIYSGLISAMGFYPMVLRAAGQAPSSPLNDWIGYAVYFIVSALLTGFAMRSLERANTREVQQALDRQAAEYALATNRVQLGLVFEATEAVAWEWDAGDQRLKWTGPVALVLGLSEPPSDFETLLARVNPADRPLLARHFSLELADPEGAFQQEYRYRGADGISRWLESRGRVVRDEGGRPQRMLGTTVGIDHRKNREEVRRRDEALVRELVADLDLGLIYFDHRLKPAIWNQRALEWMGENGDLHHFFEVPLEGEDGKALRPDLHPVRLALVEGEPTSGLYRRGDPGQPGPWLFFRCERKSLGEHPEPGIVLTMQDFSRLRVVEKALQETEKSWFGLLTQIPDHIFSVDPAGRILWANRPLPGKQVAAGTKLSDHLDPESARLLMEQVGQVFEKSESRDLEGDGPGGARWSWHLSPVVRGGTVAACFLFAGDVSRRHEAESALRDSRERFRIAFEASPDGMALLGPDGLILQANAKLAELSRRNDLVGAHWSDLARKGEQAKVLEAMTRLLGGEIEVARAERAWEPSGQGPRFVKESLSLVRGAEGQPRVFVAQVEDVTTSRLTTLALAESEKRLRAMVEGLPFGIVFYDRNEAGDLIFAGFNPVGQQILGVELKPLVGKEFTQAFPGVVGTELPERYREVMATGKPYTVSEYNYDHGGIRGVYHVVAFPIGENRMAVFFQDNRDAVAERKAQFASRAFEMAAVENLSTPLFFLSPRGEILQGNREAQTLFGRPGGNLREMLFEDLLVPDGPSRWATMAHVLAGGRRLDFDGDLKGPMESHPYRLRLEPIATEEGSRVLVMALPRGAGNDRRPPTTRVEAKHTPSYESLLTDLSGMLTVGGGGALCLVLLAVQGIDEIEETLGDEWAQTVMERARSALSPLVKEAGAVLHWVETNLFAAVLPGAPLMEGQREGARWVMALAQTWSGGQPHLAAQGMAAVAAAPQHGTQGRDLIRAAKMALRSGRKEDLPVTTFRPELERPLPRRRRLLADLPGVVERGELKLWAQSGLALPMAPRDKEAPLWVELFLRWAHPHGGTVMPAEFLPLAEIGGETLTITEALFNMGAKAFAPWDRAGFRGDVHFNIAPHLASDLDLPDLVARWCEQGNLDPRRTGLDVPEWALHRDGLHTAAVTDKLARRGHPIWLDDFGTHPLSLIQLAELNLTGVKLGPALVRGLPGNSRVQALVTSLAVAGRALGFALCAEGVENPETLPLLTSLGVSRIQGHASGKPEPVGPLPPGYEIPFNPPTGF